jgi:hypothetical protein
MRWLAGKLGIDRVKRAEVILPDAEYFPDPYTGVPGDARRIFDRVCGYMGLDPDRLDLDVVPDDDIPGFAGQYIAGERPRIVLASTQLLDTERLVATIAHELAHEILLGGKLVTLDVDDHEPLTDLVPVFLGLGLFMANAPLRDRSPTEKDRRQSKPDHQGYLPSRILGYALALFAYIRGESRPDWAGYLRPDAAQTLTGGLRYLLKTGDSLFEPETAHLPLDPPNESVARQRLLTGSPTFQARTLYDIAELKPPPAALYDDVASFLCDRDADLQIAAARALPAFGEAARGAVPDLIHCAGSRSEQLRIDAAITLAAIGDPPDQIVLELTRLLEDRFASVVDAAVDGLLRLAPHAAAAVPALVQVFRARETACEWSDGIADLLVAIGPTADVVAPLLEPIDPEIQKRMNRALRAARFRRRSEQLQSSDPPETEVDRVG